MFTFTFRLVVNVNMLEEVLNNSKSFLLEFKQVQCEIHCGTCIHFSFSA